MARKPKKAGGTGKGRGKAKAKPAGRGGNGRALHKNDNGGSEDAIRASFVQHNSRYVEFRAKQKMLDKQLKDIVAAARAEGFQKKQFVIAEMLAAGTKKEARVVGEVKDRLQVARWIGHPMGRQLDLFEGGVVEAGTRIVDAADLGKQAAMEGAKASPPETLNQDDQQRWLEAFHAERERMVKANIKPLDDKGNGEDKDVESSPEDPEGSKPAAGWGKSAGADL